MSALSASWPLPARIPSRRPHQLQQARRPTAVPATTVDAPPPPSRRTKRALESPEERAARARPANWTPPGPSPVGGDPVLQPGETLSFLSGDWRIFQLADGHRWSIDDHVTAMVALQEARRLRRAQGAAAAPLRTLDLGCGIGSVLLMTAWGLLLQQEEEQAATAPPTSRCLCCVGLEAQAVSAALARRSVEYNLGSSAANSGVTVIEGDLRDREVRAAAIAAAASAAAGAGAAAPLFELITGTPPYIPPGSGALSNRPQKGACCVETRGGVEEYCAAAAELLAAPEGGSDRSVFVCCAGVTPDDTRARRAAQEAGLSVRRRVVVVPRRGKPPLFEVLVMEKRGGGGGGGAGGAARDDPGAASAAAAAIEDEVFVVREADGSLAADMHAARAALGMPPAKGAPAKV